MMCCWAAAALARIFSSIIDFLRPQISEVLNYYIDNLFTGNLHKYPVVFRLEGAAKKERTKKNGQTGARFTQTEKTGQIAGKVADAESADVFA
jgi:hypothetical protein